MGLPHVGAKIPHSLNEKLKQRCAETGESTSAIVKAALSEYLGVHDADSAQSVNKRLAAVERKLKRLAKII